MRFVAAAALVVLAAVPSAQTVRPAPAAAAKPKLVVLISVDQMRGDYVDRFRHQWTKGLHRLVTEGAWFRQADYPYYNTVTCAGHASMSTGTVPAIHGMVLNQWWERNNSRLVACTDDEDAKLITYGRPVKSIGNSAKYLMSNTLSDEMRLQGSPAPKVVGISLKARSAIMLGGRRPDAVIWLDEADGEWVTSTAFATAPSPVFADYIAKHPLKNEMGRKWDRMLPRERYLYDYSKENRRGVALSTSEFPHIVQGRGNEVGGAFTDAWESSPYSDAYLNALAMAAIDGMKLGRGPATDFIGISFSALDKVGHDFGPDSHESQDVLIHLDQQLGLLMDKLDRDLGKGNYVIGLTSDHGVAPVPERVKAMGFDAGRIDTGGVGRAIDAVLVSELGPGSYRTRVIYNDIYFNEGIYLKLQQNPKAMEAVLDTVRKTPGVWRVYRKEDLSAGDPLTRAPAFSHYEGRSGDIKMLGRAYWITSSSTTTHGTGHRYDTRVPVMLFGHGIKPGEYIDPAAPLDLAPTLAHLTGVTLPDATGRVLSEALVRR
ncbi:MAG TPA: alkaline phosphatase family protein [Vicinamibacterales bacterium]|nr:alkaline phosphatase family protein [Vicinamibacterales bacterium]